MAPFKKKPADEYRVPSLAEADGAYADLLAKRMELEQRYCELNTQRSKRLSEIAAAKVAGGKFIAPAVA